MIKIINIIIDSGNLLIRIITKHINIIINFLIAITIIINHLTARMNLTKY